MKNNCYIFSAGEYYSWPMPPENFSDDDFIIAADGGYTSFVKIYGKNSRLNMIIGDFDSIFKIPQFSDIKIVTLPKEKDITDTEAAISAGYDKGYIKFHIFGGTGGRLDHTLANIQNIVRYTRKDPDVKMKIYGNNQVITAITDSAIEFPADFYGYVSVFAQTEFAQVNISGLKYELNNVILRNDNPLGVSNEFIGKKSRISVANGTIIIVFEQNKQ